MSEAIRIDIVSDVVCPWCAVGYNQLKQALADSGTQASIHWHPFELNPTMGPEGQNLREHLAEKYGTTPEQSREVRQRITDLGADLGFTFNFTDDLRMVNTFRAHQLIHWAAEQGKETEMKLALFEAYFTHGRDLHDLEILAEVASSLDLNADHARDALEKETYAQAVRQEQSVWTAQGITSVPVFIFNQKYLVPGAAGIDQFKKLLADLA